MKLTLYIGGNYDSIYAVACTSSQSSEIVELGLKLIFLILSAL